MTEEIKEIIEHIKTYPEKMYCLSEKEKVIMLDYITNLQQAIEIKNQRIKEEQQEKERYIKSYNGLNTWNKELQQENEKLKHYYSEEFKKHNVKSIEDYIKAINNVNEKLKEELKNRPIVDFTYDVYEELEDYKSRCKKAIEYIKAVGVLPKQIDSFVLLNILNGSDEK